MKEIKKIFNWCREVINNFFDNALLVVMLVAGVVLFFSGFFLYVIGIIFCGAVFAVFGLLAYFILCLANKKAG